MRIILKLLRAAAWILVLPGFCCFFVGLSLAVGAVRHNMKWRAVEASVICVSEKTSATKICSLRYFVNGAELQHRLFQSEAVAEGLIGKYKIYYLDDDPGEISFSRDCGLGFFVGEVTAFTGFAVIGLDRDTLVLALGPRPR